VLSALQSAIEYFSVNGSVPKVEEDEGSLPT
jgi:hypothetical protein